MGLEVVVLGAGGIGQAAAMMLLAWAEDLGCVTLIDVHEGATEAARRAVEQSGLPARHPGRFATAPYADLAAAVRRCDLLLDATPGAFAPQHARLAVEHQVYYANLTEYVAETEAIQGFAQGARRGVLLQAGLAPGYIDILALTLWRHFTARQGVDTADEVLMRVGALPQVPESPHFYGFTWSPVGVATEYVRPAVVVRDGQVTSRPSLTDLETRVIGGGTFEAALTSGGAANVPQRLQGRVRTVDYKTLRHPGHYAWVQSLLARCPPEADPAECLEREMLAVVPTVEADQVVAWAEVAATDARGVVHRLEHGVRVLPIRLGDATLRAIQATTAAGLLEAALQVVRRGMAGVILQSDLDGDAFLGGAIVRHVFGPPPRG